MRTLRVQSWCVIAALALVLAAAGGCKSKKKDTALNTGFDTADTATTGEGRGSEGLPDVELERLLFDRSGGGGLRTIYFDYDSFQLRPDALETLRYNADLLRQAPGVMVQIEGHCDERGTQEYNLALGEKRALAARQHLMNLGISGDRLITISYGEEDPVDPGHNEAAWAKNRRAEFNRAR